MPYIIETWDKESHQELRQKLRQSHLEYLNQRLELLLACGAKLDNEGHDLGGGVYIINTDNQQEATDFIEQDPFFTGELFQKITITHWRKSYFDGKFCL